MTEHTTSWGRDFDPDRLAQVELDIYEVPEARVAEAGTLRGHAAEVRDRGATADPAGPTGPGDAYWPEVGALLQQSDRSLKRAVNEG